MPRLGFKREEVVDSAMQLFWKSGYASSSMQHIFQATGLKPGSIYLAFENKASLFKETLKRYAQQSNKNITAHLEEFENPEVGICNILIAIIKEATRSDYCSCFLVKSQLELSGSEQTLFEYTKQQLLSIEATYQAYLKMNHSKQQASIYASSVMLSIFGIRVYGYMNQTEEQLLAATRTNLHWLPWEDALTPKKSAIE